MRKVILALFLLVTLLIFTNCASLPKNKGIKAEDLVRQLNLKLKGPSVWLDFKAENFPLWFYSKQQSSLFSYSQLQLKKLSVLENQKWILNNSLPFTSIIIKGQKTLVVNLDHENFKNYEQLTHDILKESFKVFYQQSNAHWLKTKPTTTPQYYPSLERPRYYRYEMTLNLEEYLKTKNTKYLKAYAWWFKKWKREFPEESDQKIDREIGSNELLAYSYSLNTHKNKDAELIELFKKRNFYSLDYKFELFNLHKEAEFLGLLSGLTLYTLDKDSDLWKKKVNRGSSMLEILSKKFQASPQTPNVQVLNDYIQINIKKMDILDPLNLLSSAVQRLSNETNIRVVLNNSKLKTSSTNNKGIFKSFFNFKNVDHVSFVWLSTPLDLSRPDFKYHLDADEIWIHALKTPCHPNRESTILIFDSPENETLALVRKLKYKEIIINKTHWYCL